LWGAGRDPLAVDKHIFSLMDVNFFPFSITDQIGSGHMILAFYCKNVINCGPLLPKSTYGVKFQTVFCFLATRCYRKGICATDLPEAGSIQQNAPSIFFNDHGCIFINSNILQK